MEVLIEYKASAIPIPPSHPSIPSELANLSPPTPLPPLPISLPPTMHPTLLPTLLSITLSLSLLIAYHAYLIHLVRNHPASTLIGLTRLGRKKWVKAMTKSNNAILGVQTLRNYLMTSTLLAGTAMTVCVGLLAVVANGGGGVVRAPPGGGNVRGLEVVGAGVGASVLEKIGRRAASGVLGVLFDAGAGGAAAGVVGAATVGKADMESYLDLVVEHELFGLKIVALLISFTTGFFCFTQSMRYFNHVGILIGLLAYQHQQSTKRQSPSPSSSSSSPSTRRRKSPSLPKSHFTHDHRLRHPPSVTEDLLDDEGLTSRSRSGTRDLGDEGEDEGYGGSRDSRDARRAEYSTDEDEEDEGIIIDVDKTANLLNRGAVFYTIGNRCYYLAIPTLLWFFGPWFLLSGTFLLTGESPQNMRHPLRRHSHFSRGPTLLPIQRIVVVRIDERGGIK
ncbi:hypothetical protein HDV00_010042 [Rhizophlyctis rosea]|nr:hypothetical protein HDV00_010042 [Rhizophlyctis rosea]